MRYLLYLFSVFILFSCTTVKETKSFYYQNEEGKADFYNYKNHKKPLLVVIPAVYNSLFTEDYITALSKKNRVVVIHFLSSTNATRVSQLDGLQNRLNYYSTVLSDIDFDPTHSSIIAEGFNASIALQLGHNFGLPSLIFINPWYPNLRDNLNTSCYSRQDYSCDSLLNYLSFTDRFQVDNLIASLSDKSSTDNLYGNYYLQTWRDFMDYDNTALLKMYPSNPRWIYTTNTGLISKNDFQLLQKSTGKQKDIYLLSKKDFLKKQSLLSN